MALIAPYLRIPLVLAFLRPRPNVLLSASLRHVIMCALFEPLATVPIVQPAAPSGARGPVPVVVGAELAKTIDTSLGHLSSLPVLPQLRRGVLSDATGMMQVRC